jgi:hypothetical protein
MKKIIISAMVLLISVGVFFIYPIWINPKSPRAKTSLGVEELKIEIRYSSPSKRGRLIFGTEDQEPLLTYGKYWRLGANAPTKISIDKDIKFAGKDLKSGNYSMYAVPYKDYWDITLNSQISSSGFERPDPSFDVFTVSIALSSSTTPVEQFTISLKKMGSNVTMTMEWDKAAAVVTIELQ